MKGTAGLFAHKDKHTTFSLCVDNIGAKYHSQEDLDHLMTGLQKHYKLLTIEWDYKNGYVDISMTNYVSTLT